MEVNDELLIKAIKQAFANVSLEFDNTDDIEKLVEIEKQKILVLKGKNNSGMGRLYYR